MYIKRLYSSVAELQSCKLLRKPAVAGSNPSLAVLHTVWTQIGVPWLAISGGGPANVLPLDCRAARNWSRNEQACAGETVGLSGPVPIQTIGGTPRALSAFQSRTICNCGSGPRALWGHAAPLEEAGLVVCILRVLASLSKLGFR